jgi:SH3-like domain-containing protein
MAAKRNSGRNGGMTALVLGALCALCAAAPASAQSAKTPPYWASIAKSEALARVGPSQDYPAKWLYQRRDLPVKVIETYPGWRKIEDPDGTQGWMHVRLLKDDPTGIVKGGVAEMRDGPSAESPLLYRLAPGVVGHLRGCAGGWCAFAVDGKSGYVAARDLWGATIEK